MTSIEYKAMINILNYLINNNDVWTDFGKGKIDAEDVINQYSKEIEDE